MTLPQVDGSPRRGRVLVVDANIDEREGLRKSLSERGFEVQIAPTGIDGLEKARSWGPLVIILSIQLGMAELRLFKMDESCSTVPLMVHSPEPADDETAVAALDGGANDVISKPYSSALLAARVSAQIAIYRSQFELREKVIRDELTGVFSRRYLFESMRQHVNQFSRPGPPVLCCLMIDVDHFKLVNDRLGHIEGDRILRLVAELIFGMTRKGDVVARFGGEEFVVILPSTDPEGARLVAEKLRKAVESDSGVTISIGVSWYESPAGPQEKSLYSDEEMMHLLLSRADEALYNAKRQGRNQVCLGSDYGGPERRRRARVEAPFRVEMVRLDGVRLERVAEVSAGGLAINDSTPLAVADELEICILLEDGLALARGRVVWTCAIRGVGERCGVAFESFQDGQERLIHLLGHRARVDQRPTDT